MKANKIRKIVGQGRRVVLNVLVIVGSEEEASDIEIALVRKLGRRNQKTGELCNLTDGGEGTYGVVYSEETRKRMAVAKTGNKTNVGRKRPDMVKRFSKPVSMYDQTGRFIASFPSARWAEKITGVDYRAVHESLSGRINSTKTPSGQVVQFRHGVSTENIGPCLYRPYRRWSQAKDAEGSSNQIQGV